MIRRISTKAHFASQELLEFACADFGTLLLHPAYREDALQELRMVEAFAPREPRAREAEARRALAWLSYDLGLSPAKPRCRKPKYVPLPLLEEGTFIADLSDRLEVALAFETEAA